MSELIVEIFDNVQDTGYRICETVDKVNQSTTNYVFNALFDPNNKNKLWITTQNGLIRKIDLLDRSASLFRVVFQRVLSIQSSEVNEEKEINYHYDKFILIPNQLNQFIFLLGVSRTIMFSSLPNNTQSNGICTEFIYGTPIIQLYSHNYRVTCLSISKDGLVLISGDEQGHVYISIMKSCNNNSINRKIHNGPIYSIEWFEINSNSNNKNITTASFATGSNDRAVIIWKLVYTPSNGLVVSPLIQLSTMTSSMLCMSSFLFEDSIYLSGGTDLGSVYVWRLQNLTKLISCDLTDRLIDDGSYLHSLMPSSDRPVIQISISLTNISIIPNTLPSSHIALVTADTTRRVRFHLETNLQEEFSPVYRPSYGPIAFTYELVFPNPIVSCCFSPIDKSVRYGDIKANVLVVLLDGFMQFYSLQDTCSVSKGDNQNIEIDDDTNRSIDLIGSMEFSSFISPVVQLRSSNNITKQVPNDDFNEINVDDEPSSMYPLTNIPTPSPKPQLVSYLDSDEPRPQPASALPSPVSNYNATIDINSNNKYTNINTINEMKSNNNNNNIKSQVNLKTIDNIIRKTNINSPIDIKVSPTKPVVENAKDKPVVENAKYKPVVENARTTSELAYPSLHSSKIIYDKLTHLQNKLSISDEMSISTVDTTSTDRALASRYVHSMTSALSNKYYSQLPVDNNPVNDNIRSIGKQVDKHWLYNKKHCGPSVEDVAVLYPPDALVDINILPSRSKRFYTPNRIENKLECSIDPSTLFSRYNYNISIDDVLGPVDIEKSLDFGNIQINSYIDQHVYDSLSFR